MPVRFSDIDHAGIVYFPKFFDYFHVAFEELFRQNLGPRSYADILDKQRLGFPWVKAHCDFKSPLRFGDTVEVCLWPTHLGRSSIRFGYRISRQADPEDGVDIHGQGGRVVAAEGENTCVVTSLCTFRPVPLPDWLQGFLKPLLRAEGRSGDR